MLNLFKHCPYLFVFANKSSIPILFFTFIAFIRKSGCISVILLLNFSLSPFFVDTYDIFVIRYVSVCVRFAILPMKIKMLPFVPSQSIFIPFFSSSTASNSFSLLLLSYNEISYYFKHYLCPSKNVSFPVPWVIKWRHSLKSNVWPILSLWQLLRVILECLEKTYLLLNNDDSNSTVV